MRNGIIYYSETDNTKKVSGWIADGTAAASIIRSSETGAETWGKEK